MQHQKTIGYEERTYHLGNTVVPALRMQWQAAVKSIGAQYYDHPTCKKQRGKHETIYGNSERGERNKPRFQDTRTNQTYSRKRGRLRKAWPTDSYARRQLIATLDNADYKLGVDALQAQYDQLANETKRLGILYKDKSIPANDYEKALAGLKQVRIQLQANKNKLSYTRLYAPTAGYVDKVNFDEAEMVDAGTPVITLLDTIGKEVEADIPADLYLDNENIISVACRHPYGGGPLPMRITSITPKADGNQLYRMRATFRSIPSGVTAGMNIETIITIADKDTTGTEFTLPLHSIFNDNGKDYVWTVETDTTVHKTAVTLAGMDSDGNAIVSAGLSGNEIVVKAGVEYLQDNDKVKIVNRTSETNIGNIL